MTVIPDPTDWLVSIRPMLSPTHRSTLPAVTAKKQRLLDLWSARVAPVTDRGDADYEDFYEQAAKLSAALAVGAHRIWVDVHDGHPRNAGTGQVTTDAAVSGLRRWGSQPTADDWIAALRVERLADGYASLSTFRRHAGRTVILAGFHAPGSPELVDAVRAAANASDGRRVFVKVNRQKYGIFEFTVPLVADDNAIRDLLFEEMGFTLIHLEEAAEAFIVQSHATMNFEYRLFVVNHQVVAGAGCVEEFTPLDNERSFDVKVRRSRHHVSQVEERPDVVSRLQEFGRVTAAAIALEQPELVNYGLDVALGADDEPLIVELNTSLNSGLYATDVDRVFRAMDAAPLAAIADEVVGVPMPRLYQALP